MENDTTQNREHVRAATTEEIALLLHDPATEVLLELLDNPALDEGHLQLLLERKDLPGEVLEEIVRRKIHLKNYRLKRALVFHPRVPRLAASRLIRELYPMDLAQLAMLPSAAMELRRNAEDQLIARLAQLPLGHKMTLARRASARVAGALLGQGNMQVVGAALDNSALTEAQILKVLWKEKLPGSILKSVAAHPKWSCVYNVRLALVRNAGTTLAVVLSYLPELTVTDLRQLVAPGVVPEGLRKYLQAEIYRRTHRE